MKIILRKSRIIAVVFVIANKVLRDKVTMPELDYEQVTTANYNRSRILTG